MAEQQFEYSIAILKQERADLKRDFYRYASARLKKRIRARIAGINVTILALKQIRARNKNQKEK